MQTSHYQQPLIVVLALGLGFSLASGDAIGYPSGPSVSMGSNPTVSAAGRMITSSGFSTTLLTTPADQDLIITDLSFQYGYYSCGIVLKTTGGKILASHLVGGRYTESLGYPQIERRLNTGIKVPAGSTVVLTEPDGGGGCGLSKTTARLTLGVGTSTLPPPPHIAYTAPRGRAHATRTAFNVGVAIGCWLWGFRRQI